MQALKISWGLLRQCPNYILFSKRLKYPELCLFIFLYVMQKLIILLQDYLYFLLSIPYLNVDSNTEQQYSKISIKVIVNYLLCFQYLARNKVFFLQGIIVLESRKKLENSHTRDTIPSKTGGCPDRNIKRLLVLFN